MHTMSSSSDLHVVFGATGALGSAVVRELVQLGRSVRVVSRSGAADVPPGVERVSGDATNPTSSRAVCRDAAVVYHCIGFPCVEGATRYPQITEGIINGAVAAGAKLIVADSLHMYGKVQGRITEDLTYTPTSRRGQVGAQVATRVMQAHRSGHLWAAIGRAADLYGPGVVHSVAGEHLFRAVLQGKRAMWFGNLDMPHSLTFLDDFARGLVTLSEHEDAPGQIWHIPTAEPLTGRQFLQMAFEEAGTTPKMDAFSRPIMTVMGLFSPQIRDFVETLYQFEAPFVLDTSKYRRTFGDMPATPHREAIRQTLDWFRSHPSINTSADWYG